MAKYDYYDIMVTAEGDDNEVYRINLKILFEEGDDVVALVREATDFAAEESRRVARKGYRADLP